MTFENIAMHNTTILQIIPTLNAGGAERTTLDVAKAIVDAGGRAIVVSQGGRLVPALEASGALHIRLPVASKNPLTMWRNAAALQRIIAEYGVHLVHARSRAPAWSAFMAAQRANIPFITTYHGIYNSKSALKRLYNSIMARGQVVIANSNFTAAHIARHHAFAAQNVVVIPRGTDFEQLNPNVIAPQRVADMRAIWGVETPKIILLPARLTRWKGQLVLIEAMAQLKRDGNLPADVCAVLAGDAQGRYEYVAELQAAIALYGLQNVVKLAPHITDMPAAYAASFAVVVPSTDPEAFGRVPVEAQAMGVPVIVSNHGAPRETVISTPIETRTGWHVPPADAQALAGALQEVLNLSDETRATLAIRARTHVLAHYSLPQMLEATLQVYVRVLA